MGGLLGMRWRDVEWQLVGEIAASEQLWPWDDSIRWFDAMTLAMGWFKSTESFQITKEWIQLKGICDTNYEQPTCWWNSSCSNSCDCGMIRGGMRWPAAMGWFKSTELFQITLFFGGIPWGVFFWWWASQALWTVPLKQARNALSLLLKWIHILIDDFRLIYLYSPKTNSKSPWKNGWNWNNYIRSFPLLLRVWA